MKAAEVKFEEGKEKKKKKAECEGELRSDKRDRYFREVPRQEVSSRYEFRETNEGAEKKKKNGRSWGELRHVVFTGISREFHGVTRETSLETFSNSSCDVFVVYLQRILAAFDDRNDAIQG